MGSGTGWWRKKNAQLFCAKEEWLGAHLVTPRFAASRSLYILLARLVCILVSELWAVQAGRRMPVPAMAVGPEASWPGRVLLARRHVCQAAPRARTAACQG
jgi:hypothetical protein